MVEERPACGLGDEGHVQLWDVSGRPRLVRELHGLRAVTRYPEAVTALAFSPDGALVAAGDVNHTAPAIQWRFGTAAVWDVASGQLLWKARSKRGWVNSVSFSPDGANLAAGDESGIVALYDAPSAVASARSRSKGAATRCSPTSRVGRWRRALAGIVQLWDPATGRELGKPTAAAAAPVSRFPSARRGATFATTRGSDGIARLWTTASLQQFGSNLPGAPNSGGTPSTRRTKPPRRRLGGRDRLDLADVDGGASRRTRVRSPDATSLAQMAENWSAAYTGRPAPVSRPSAGHKRAVSASPEPPRTRPHTAATEAKEALRCPHCTESS